MIKYDGAVSEDPRTADDAREWLLKYNRAEDEPTSAIRDWLKPEGSEWPDVDAS